ncbi:MAG: hypothetical protein SH850_17255, partial [Planctomycetaceae bacterium]|nr:hypothetical protein [Planctomycetaceae bacterium]
MRSLGKTHPDARALAATIAVIAPRSSGARVPHAAITAAKPGSSHVAPVSFAVEMLALPLGASIAAPETPRFADVSALYRPPSKLNVEGSNPFARFSSAVSLSPKPTSPFLPRR